MKKDNIYNKVKGLVAVLLIAPFSALLLTGCEDFFEVEPQDRITLEKFWNEKSDVNNVLMSCYSAMQSSNMIGRMMVWGEFRSDNVYTGSNTDKDVSLERVLEENIDPSNAYTAWNEFYGVINRCNTVMLYAPQVAAKDPAYSETELKATIAEATAIRALCYFYLIRTFCNVPYTTEAYIDDTKKRDIAPTSFDVVLDSLISDLERVQDDAMTRYPESDSEKALYNTARITQAAIHAMLCEMYLWKEDYDNCVKYADLVIDYKKKLYDTKYAGYIMDSDNRLNGYPLVLDWEGRNSYYFGNAYTSIFGSGNSDEGILELTYSSNTGMLRNGAVNTFYGFGSGNDLRGYVGPSTYVSSDIEDEKFDVFKSKYDTRYYENIYPHGNKVFSIGKSVIRTVLVSVQNSTKPVAAYSSGYAKDNNYSNWIIYRLSDIMLLKAEALVEKMDNANDATVNNTLRQQAFSLVNAVNKRSVCQTNLTDTLVYREYNTKAKLQTLVLQERQRELMFEGKRWFDLVRRSLRDGNADYLVSCISQKGLENASLVSNRMKSTKTWPGQIFWPYNLDETKVSEPLAKNQNPAYPSGEDGSIKTSAN